MEVHVLKSGWPPDLGKNTAYLKADNWNDYSFVTQFRLFVFDNEGTKHEIGDVKIGFLGQTEESATHEKLPPIFTQLEYEFFSVGGSSEYYKSLYKLPRELRDKLLSGLNDIVVNEEIIGAISDENVFSTSLLRYNSLSTIKGQFKRLLEGNAELTDYHFTLRKPASNTSSTIELEFRIDPTSMPRSNIHAIIGRNGVGKTTILNTIIQSIMSKDQTSARLYDRLSFISEDEIASDYFSSLVSVSFSAFDPFSPPAEQPDPSKGTCYFYIGLKDVECLQRHRTITDLRDDCVKALIQCFRTEDLIKRWKNAIEKLGSDENFASMNLVELIDVYIQKRRLPKEQTEEDVFREQFKPYVLKKITNISSGHFVILLTISRLVAKVEEKTLVLLDEPESHLHPPLLSAFIRALSDLLHDRNGVAIIATHSPVILQEIPSSCAWKITRHGLSLDSDRPSIETFGENVGTLTSEVFSLEVEKSGFHDLLSASVKSGSSYDTILEEYGGNIGFEGRAILKSLIAERKIRNPNDSP